MGVGFDAHPHCFTRGNLQNPETTIIQPGSSINPVSIKLRTITPHVAAMGAQKQSRTV